jgi:hypothetical protein
VFAAAYLESQLGVLLNHYFIDDDSTAMGLLNGKGVLASFSSRIDLSLLLGLISASVAAELHLIRKIRNDFAHHPEPITFSHTPIADRCRALRHAPLATDSRGRYLQATMAIAGAIDGAVYGLNSGGLTKCKPVVTKSINADSILGTQEQFMQRMADMLEPPPSPTAKSVRRKKSKKAI